MTMTRFDMKILPWLYTKSYIHIFFELFLYFIFTCYCDGVPVYALAWYCTMHCGIFPILGAKTRKSFQCQSLTRISFVKMYIKQVTIDGFKSYAQRTVISGFDPLFNAITGLNGSGKSNILDSICFLLGITNLSHVSYTNIRNIFI